MVSLFMLVLAEDMTSPAHRSFRRRANDRAAPISARPGSRCGRMTQPFAPPSRRRSLHTVLFDFQHTAVSFGTSRSGKKRSVFRSASPLIPGKPTQAAQGADRPKDVDHIAPGNRVNIARRTTFGKRHNFSCQSELKFTQIFLGKCRDDAECRLFHPRTTLGRI